MNFIHQKPILRQILACLSSDRLRISSLAVKSANVLVCQGYLSPKCPKVSFSIKLFIIKAYLRQESILSIAKSR